jgi:type I restriction enzyme, S subunit
MGIRADALQIRSAAASVDVTADPGDVPKGYKRTEVGLIPAEWRVSDLGAICSFENGDRSTNYPSPGSFVSEGIPFINAGHLDDGRIALRDMDYITQTAFNRLGGGKVHVGDILFCLRGTLGKFGVVEPGFIEGAIASSLVIVRPRRDVIREFLAFYFASDLCTRMIEKWAGGAAQPNLGAQDLARFSMPIPPTPEQHAIGEALSDMDGLLGALEALIAKKRAIKQAAMQQLLTGRTRPPGFHGEWAVKRIGEFADCTAGGTPSTRMPSYWGGSIRWMSSGELTMRRVYDVEGRITEEGLRNSSTKRIPARCVLIGLAGQGKTRGTVAMNFVELCTNQSIAAILPNTTFVPEYLYFNLDSRYDELRELSSGGGGRGGLNLTLIKSLALPFPSVAEQTAIATVLSDMDAEISALEARCDKTRAIKQGMMQQLLTGRVRLVRPESAEAGA